MSEPTRLTREELAAAAWCGPLYEFVEAVREWVAADKRAFPWRTACSDAACVLCQSMHQRAVVERLLTAFDAPVHDVLTDEAARWQAARRVAQADAETPRCARCRQPARLQDGQPVCETCGTVEG